MKQRILLAISSLRVGGAERAVSILARELSREQFELDLALVEGSGELVSSVPSDVMLHELATRPGHTALLPLVSLIWQLRPHVVLAHLGELNPRLAAWKPFLPRGLRILLQEAKNPGARGTRRAVLRRLYARCDGVICASEAVAADIKRDLQVLPRRLHGIPYPIDEPAIERALKDGSDPYPAGGPHIVGVGRLVREQSYDLLLEAFACLAPRHPEAQLWLVGDGPERVRLRQTAQHEGLAERVHFVGFQEDPFPWMRHAHVFVQPSRHSGVPVAVMEALACGARLAAFDGEGGAAEILRPVEGAVLARNGSVDGLADAVEQLIAGPEVARPFLPERYRLYRVLEAYGALLAGEAVPASTE